MIKLNNNLIKLKNNFLRFIEVHAGNLHQWAWTKRAQQQDSETWVKGYREWQKRKCPHN